MNYLINKYINEHKNTYQTESIAQSSLSSEIISTLKVHKIVTIYDLLTVPKETLESAFYELPDEIEEIEEYIISIHSDIIDELDNFSQLDEWNMFLDAVNEVMSLDPLTCVVCDENPSAFSMNIADGININVCDVCAEEIKNKIYTFLRERGLW